MVPLTIALDTMGGDHGPKVVIGGAELSRRRHPDTRYLMFGHEDAIKPILKLKSRKALAERCEIIHTDVAVPMDAKPSQALRKGRGKSSMWLAIEAVRDDKADAAVSAGNTGALMAMARFCLKSLPGIERPAIAAIWPTVDGECIVLDVGANVSANARQLIDFAVMGAAMAQGVLHHERPSVGLLNIGVEEIKGLEEIRRAGATLRNSEPPFDYRGFIEGDDVGQGAVDVVVIEGFAGNIALKTAEGTAKQIAEYLHAAMNRSVLAQFGAFLARAAFRALSDKMDPRHSNGGIFLGLNGIVIKSHGGTDATGFASAIDLSYEMAHGRLVERIAKNVEKFHAVLNHGDIS